MAFFIIEGVSGACAPVPTARPILAGCLNSAVGLSVGIPGIGPTSLVHLLSYSPEQVNLV